MVLRVQIWTLTLDERDLAAPVACYLARLPEVARSFREARSLADAWWVVPAFEVVCRSAAYVGFCLAQWLGACFEWYG